MPVFDRGEKIILYLPTKHAYNLITPITSSVTGFKTVSSTNYCFYENSIGELLKNNGSLQIKYFKMHKYVQAD